MSETDRPAARRALPPRDEPDESALPRRLAQGPADDTDEPADTPAPRRAFAASGPAAPAASDPPAGTQDADDETVADGATLDAAPAETETEAEPTGTSSRGRWAWIAAAVAVVALLVAGLILAASGAFTPQAAPPPDRSPLLLQPNDLAPLREGATWEVSKTFSSLTADTPQARCLQPASELQPSPTESHVRTLSATGPTGTAALHQLDRYASENDAVATMESRVAELGACGRTIVWLTQFADITGVADRAVVARYVAQEATAEHHTIVVARTGRDITTLDLVATDTPWQAESALTALTEVSKRLCAETGGTCPESPALVPQAPPVGDPPGWLAAIDLPRLSPGVGVWRSTAVTPPVLAGAVCEVVDLVNVPGATLTQRAYLLHDDPRSSTFGIDEAIYTFATPEEAGALAGQLIPNIDGCPDRTATATVQRTAELQTATASGPSWAITQKLNDQQSARFRVSVIHAGTRVLYLFANPTEAIDFSDEEWQTVVARAAERLSQLP